MRIVDYGYYDTENLQTIEEIFYVNDLKQRKLFLTVDIEQASVAEIVRNIMQFNTEDKGIDVKDRKPIFLYVASNGGEVDSGFELIDIISASKTPVYTVNMGFQYSMGFLIGLAGHKRFCTKNARFLMHDGSSLVMNSTGKAHDQMEFLNRVEGKIKNYILEKSNITEEEYDRNIRVEWYLFSDEAKEKGFTDYIIGVDCELDDII